MKVTLLLSLLVPISKSFQFPTVQKNEIERRTWIANTFIAVGTNLLLENANADDADAEPYESPLEDTAPEERSGLVVLRVAEVCNFQEKILRAVVNKDIDAEIGPLQIVFGTQILLKNSNIAGNMKLMIETEIPRAKRRLAAKNAANAMNTLQSIQTTAGKIQRPFTDEEMLEIADLYRDARIQFNALYEYLSDEGKEKYYGYFMQVTEYEKKIADGVYNPELDGVLKFDY